MKKTRPNPKILTALSAAVAALVAFAPQSKADPTLTNSLIAYWPMDTISSSILTPDLGPHGFDLQPYHGNATVLFNSANITFNALGGPHASNPNAQNGTNSLSTHNNQATELGYVYPASSVGDMVTNMLLPQLEQPNWTFSFWLKAASGGNNGGNGVTGRFWAIVDNYNNNPLNTFWDFAGSPNDATQIQHFTRQNTSSGNIINNILFLDDNPGGDAVTSTNVVLFDGTWHNVTIVSQTTTNVNPLSIDPTQFGSPTNGTVTITFTSGPLDSLYPNWAHQVDTNQSYNVEVATNIAGPWTVVSTNGGTGAGGTITFTDPFPTNVTGFYRVQEPRVRLETRTVLIDGTNVVGPPWQSQPKSQGANYRTNGAWYVNTFTFGGYMRASGEGGFTDAQFSDAAVWGTALTSSQIQAYVKDGITNISVFSPPLFANLAAEYPATAQGDTDKLSWQASKPPATLALFPGGNDVTPQSILGIGNSNLVIGSNTTFTLVATRGGASVTSAPPISVICVSNVAANWHYVDSFTYLGDGPIAGQGNWANPQHGPATASGQQNLVVYTATDGNNYSGFDGFDVNSTPVAGAGGIAGRALGSFQSVPGNTNTTFFRFFINPAATNVDPNYSEVLPINENAFLSDIGVLDVAINGGAAGGPGLTILQPTGGGPIDLQATGGASGITTSPGGYSYTNDPVNGDTNGLIAGHVYNVWIDVINNFPGVTNGFGSGLEQTNAAYYAIWLQRDDWAQRTNLFSAITCTNTFGGIMNGFVYPTGYLLSPRDYSVANQNNNTLGPSPNIRNFELRMDQGTSPQPTNAIRWDDIYVSTTNAFNGTVPVTAGGFTP